MKYITKSGDTWDSIAYEKYGSCERMADLIAANREFTKIAVFDYGTVLEISEKSEISGTNFAPPWRR